MADRAPLASRIAAAKSMAPTGAPPPAAAAPANDSVSTEAAASATSTESTQIAAASSADATAAGEADAGTESASGDSRSYGSDTERIDAAAKALEKGDLAAVKAALGRDLKLPEATARAFTALSKREEKHRKKTEAHAAKVTADEAKIAEAKREIVSESQRASAILRHAEQEFGWVKRAEKAWDARDLVTVGKSIERMCKGASLAQITQAMANMHLGKAEPRSAAEVDLEEGRAALQRDRAALEKQKQDERAAAEKQKSQATETEKRAAAVSKFGDSWKAHPFLVNPDDPDAPDPEELEKAFAAFETAWKADRSVKPKKVLDELWAKEQRKLKRLGLTPAQASNAAPAPKAGTSNGGKPPPKPRLPEPPRGNGKAATRDETREARIAAARRVTEQQMRGLRV